MDNKQLYNSIYGDLEDGVCLEVFLKKNGDIRVMLCTRDIITSEQWLKDSLAGKLNHHSQRCNIHNGNISVIDLLLGDVRSFNVDRLIKHLDLSQYDSERCTGIYTDINKLVLQTDTKLSLDNLDIRDKIIEIINQYTIKNDKQEDYISSEDLVI